MSNEFGTANIDPPKFEGYKILKLKTPNPHKGEDKTELVVRLLPPMKSYANTGVWKFYYGQHFGHYGVNTRNPDKPRARPFGCIQRKVNKQVVEACPKCDQIESQRGKKEAREEALKKANPSFDDSALSDLYRNDKELQVINEWLFRHSCQKQYWINVMTPSGEFGVLQLSYTTVKDKLEPFLKKLRDDMKIDAFSPSKGVWLKFTRTGQRPRVTDTVEYDATIRVLEDGTPVPVPKLAPMDADQVERALKICPDLSKDVVKYLTFEQIEALVNCDDAPESVDRIWGDASTTDDDSDETEAVTVAPLTVPVAALANAAPPNCVLTPVTPTPVVQAAPVVDDEEAQLVAQMAALKERKAREAAAKTAPTAAPPNMASSSDAPADFLAQFSPK